MRLWSMILHLYQPPTMNKEIVNSVLDSCYLPLFRLLKSKKNFGLTLNISGSLLLSLQELGANEFFDSVRQLHAERKIELLNSPICHPVIPLTSWEMVSRQIARNTQVTMDTLGLNPGSGFFPPELAVNSQSLSSIAGHAGFALVTDKSIRNIPTAGQYKGLNLLIENQTVSDYLGSSKIRLGVDQVISHLNKNLTSDKSILVTANDAELFGHHFEERLELLGYLLNHPGIKFIKAGDVFQKLPKKLPVIKRVFSSSWQKPEGFSQWNKNKFQKKYLKLANLADDLYKNNSSKIEGHIRESAARHLDQGWASCHLYWLSNSPWWHPELVERGAINLIHCIRSLPISWAQKSAVEIYYYNFMKEIWLHHWSENVERGYHKFDKYQKSQPNRP